MFYSPLDLSCNMNLIIIDVSILGLLRATVKETTQQVKNLNWSEADQFATYKPSREVELGSWNLEQIELVVRAELNSES